MSPPLASLVPMSSARIAGSAAVTAVPRLLLPRGAPVVVAANATGSTGPLPAPQRRSPALTDAPRHTGADSSHPAGTRRGAALRSMAGTQGRYRARIGRLASARPRPDS